MSIAIRLLRCVLVATAIWLSIPFFCNVLPAGSDGDQAWLDERCADIEFVLANVPVSDELEDVLEYTLRRYNTVGRFNVAIRPLPGMDAIGMNCPWCPGITLVPELAEGKLGSIVATNTLAHEAMHDYFPYFGHAHVDPVMDEFFDAQWKAWEIQRKRKCCGR